MKSIVLIAAPAAGKGTEAQFLQEEFNVPHISTGDILREKSKDETKLGNEIKKLIDNGLFVSDELIINILKERIQKEDCSNGYILDGFPRNIQQAKAYDDMLKELNKDIGIVVVIDIDINKALERIEGRRTCPNCNRIYSPIMMPKEENICDDCHTKLVKRNDDNADTYKKRYNTYIEKTTPLIDFYNEKNIVFHVNGNGTPEETHEQVKNILGVLND